MRCKKANFAVDNARGSKTTITKLDRSIACGQQILLAAIN
jgi:hypothetical protein